MTQPTNRRDLIAGSGLVAAAGLAAIAGTPASGAAPSTINPKLLRAMALWDKAEQACDRFDTDVEMPTRRAYGQALDLELASVTRPFPHEAVQTTFINIDDDEVRLSTEKIGSIAAARRVAFDPTWADMGDAERISNADGDDAEAVLEAAKADVIRLAAEEGRA